MSYNHLSQDIELLQKQIMNNLFWHIYKVIISEQSYVIGSLDSLLLRIDDY